MKIRSHKYQYTRHHQEEVNGFEIFYPPACYKFPRYFSGAYSQFPYQVKYTFIGMNKIVKGIVPYFMQA